jgi:hypothetical protein
VVVARVILGALCIYGIVWGIGAADTLIIPAMRSEHQNWDLSKVSHSEPGSDHYLMRCDQPCYVIAPPLSHFGFSPTLFPYISVIVDPRSDFHDFRLLASAPDEPGTFNPRPVILSKPDRLLCDLRASQPWNRLPPFPSSLRQVGFSFSGTILLRRIEISNHLDPSDYARLLYSTFTEGEPPAPYSINDLYGLRVLGFAQSTAAFLIFAVCLVLLLSFARSPSLRQVFISVSAAALFMYLPCAIYLSRCFKAALQHSFLKYGVFDEYASRYGEDFSSMSRILYDVVPAGSRVHFLVQLLDEYKSETNLIEFIHRVRFAPVEFGGAEYYFGYRWPGIYNRRLGCLKDPFSAKTVPVGPVYESGDSFIVKAVR